MKYILRPDGTLIVEENFNADKNEKGRGDYVEYQALKRNIDKWRNYGRENYSCNRIKL